MKSMVLTAVVGAACLSNSAMADGKIRDKRIRPASGLEITSSNPELDIALKNSINYVYDYLVVGPKQYPTTEIEPRVLQSPKAGIPAIPALWGSYHGTPHKKAHGYRELFCLRDVLHQAEGAALLSLNEENISMLHRFAYDALQPKRVSVNVRGFDPLDPWASAQKKTFWQEYWTLWSYDFYGKPHYMGAGFQELPAPLECLEKIYTMYEYTGDERWLSDEFMAFGKQIHEKFIPRYDFDGNGNVDNRGSGILPTLWEFEGASHLGPEELNFKLNEDGVTGSLTISKAYFKRIGVQDLALQVRFKNGGEDYLTVRVNNLVRSDGSKPILSRDYVFTENTEEARDIPVTFTVPAGVTLQSVKDGAAALVAGTDYLVEGNTVTLKGAYISKQQKTKSRRYKMSFGFHFSNGQSPRVVVESNDRGHAKDILAQKEVTLDWANLEDIHLKFNLAETSEQRREIYRIQNNMNRVAEAGDTLGVQYQATLSYEGMLRAKAKLVGAEQKAALLEEADVYQKKAATLLKNFREQWYNPRTKTYARAYDAYGNAIYGWGHENSFFMPMKELLEPGEKANAYLQFIHDHSEDLNEEAKTYLPEAFYNYGQVEKGWYWMQAGLDRFTSNRSHEQQIRTYPEIAFTNVSNTITYMMGYDPKLNENTIETLSMLPKSIGFVEVKNIPLGQSIMSTEDYQRDIEKMVNLRHDGQYQSSFTNSEKSKGAITWRAEFLGKYASLKVNGVDKKATVTSENGVEYSYVKVDVAPGQTVVVTTGQVTEKSADDWPKKRR